MNETILDVIEKAEKTGLNKFGIRVHHEKVCVGDELGVSYNSIDDAEPEKLRGICCLAIDYDGFEVTSFEKDVKAVKQSYHNGGNVILVGGTGAEYGNDEFELIIENPQVLWVQE